MREDHPLMPLALCISTYLHSLGSDIAAPLGAHMARGLSERLAEAICASFTVDPLPNPSEGVL